VRRRERGAIDRAGSRVIGVDGGAVSGHFCCFRGSVRGRCAGCGAVPPRSRAPAASLPRGRCAPPWTCEPLRPLGQGVRTGRGPARRVRSAPEPPPGGWLPVKIVE